MILVSGSLHPQRAGDGRDGAGDQHDRDPAPDRRAEQDRERRGTWPSAGFLLFFTLGLWWWHQGPMFQDFSEFPPEKLLNIGQRFQRSRD